MTNGRDLKSYGLFQPNEEGLPSPARDCKSTNLEMGRLRIDFTITSIFEVQFSTRKTKLVMSLAPLVRVLFAKMVKKEQKTQCYLKNKKINSQPLKTCTTGY
jgi:hypothetical protein